MLSEGSAVDADAALAPLAAEKALLLAVSGGPDSVALMLLAARWSKRSPPRRIAVATVDHGLRTEAAQETQTVSRWARELGFSCHILRFEGAKPATRIQELARQARYRLLADCALRIDPACAIVTAHHADDQAETILFRLCRGSGVAGLSGMAPATTMCGARLLRPLLDIPKSALEAVCNEAGHPFLRDPSNENTGFARVRLRALGATLEQQGLDRDALLRLGRRAARAETALSYAAAAAERSALLELQDARALFDANALRETPREYLLRLLEAQITRLGGQTPRLDRLERAGAVVARRLAERQRARLTLAGVLIEVGDDNVALTPAPPRQVAAADCKRG